MGQVRKQGSINIVVSFLGFGIGFLNNTFIMTNFLSENEYGLTRIMLDCSLLLGQFMVLSGPSIVLKYFPFFRNEKTGHNGLLTFVGQLMIIGTVITTAIILSLKSPFIGFYNTNSPLFNEYFSWVLLMGFGFASFNLLSSISKIYSRSLLPTLQKELVLRLLTTLFVVVYVLKLINFHSFVLLFASIPFLLAIFLFINLKANKLLQFTRPSFTKSLPSLNKILIFGFVSVLTGINQLVTQTIDSLMIGGLIGLGANGVGGYKIAVYFASLIRLPNVAIGGISYTKLSECFKNEDFVKLGLLYKSQAIVNLTIGLAILCCFHLCIEEFFSFMPASYIGGKWCVYILGSVALYEISNGMNRAILRLSSVYVYDFFLMIGLGIAAIVFNRLLIPHYGIIGAAWGTAIALLIYTVPCTFVIYKKLKVQPFQLKMIPIVVTAIGLAIIVGWLPKIGYNILDIVVRSGLFCAIYGIVIYKAKWVPSINGLVDIILNKIGLKN